MTDRLRTGLERSKGGDAGFLSNVFCASLLQPMASMEKCGECGGEFDSTATGGLCPDCLGEVLFAMSEADSGDGEEETSLVSRAPGSSGTGEGGDAEVAGCEQTRFGDYELLGEVARGGMGVVYKARQVSLNRIVAVKMIRSDQLPQEEDIQRFKTEAEAAARLRHQNIVAIHDVGEHEGRNFYSMDFVEGKSLAQFRQEERIPVRRAVGYLKTIAQAIHYAHQRGILHRDLKPSNVLIDQEDQVRVADFGLAKVMTDGSELTMSGTVMGSPSYMPPEQAEGRVREVTVRSDVYSLGAILYELLSGRPPFKGESVLGTLKMVVESEAAAPRSFNSRVPVDLETICLKCLQKDPAQRYGSAQELAEELDRFLNDLPIMARRSTVFERFWRWCRRKPIVAGLAAATCLLLFTVAIGSPIAAFRINRARQLAEENFQLAEGRAVALRQSSYATEMLLAAQEIEAHNLGQAVELLERSRPGEQETDYRGWEWRFLWGQCQGDEEFTLGAHEAEIFRLAFLPDDRVISGDFAEKIRLWDLQERTLVAERRLKNISDLEVSPDGSTVAAAYWLEEFSFLDPATLETQARQEFDSRIYHLAFSPRQQLLATAGPDHVGLWKLSGSSASLVWKSPSRNSTGIAFSPTDDLLAFATPAGRIELIDTVTHQSRASRLGHREAPSELGFSPDGLVLAVSYFGGVVTIYDPKSASEVAVLTNHTGWVSSLAFSPVAPILATSSSDHFIKLWNTTSWEETATFKGHRSLVDCVGFSSSGSRLVSGSKDRSIKVWAPDRMPAASFFPDFGEVRSGFKVSAGGEFLASPVDGELMIWNLSARRLRSRTALEPGTRVMAISRQGTQVILVTPGARGMLRQVGEGAAPLDIGVAHSDRDMAEFSPDGTAFVLGGRDRPLRLGKSDGSQPPREMEHTLDIMTRILFVPDGTRVVTACESGVIRVCDVATGELLSRWRAHKHVVAGIAVSPDGRLLATASSDGTVRLWDLASQVQLGEFGRSAIGFVSVAFSRDGSRLMAGSGDGPIKMWAIDSQREVARFDGAERISSIRFSPDDQTLVLVSDKKVDLYWAPSVEASAR